jgi:TetR/AcrR family transcriptional repressor of mexCD-oprJ operon
MTATEHRPVEFMRADAARNVHRIIEVAARMLGAHPHAGMAEVAAAAGISRATVYRHFATREALIDAIRRQAVEQGELALLGCRLDEGSATDALSRLVPAWLDLAERYSFPQLAAQSELDRSDEAREQGRRVFGEPLVALIERGQASGEFSAALAPEWASRVFGALVLTGAGAVMDGSLSRRKASDTVLRTLLGGLRG